MSEIESNIPLPEKTKRTNARARRAAKDSKDGPKLNAAAGFLSAVKFIALAQKEMGLPYQTHCLINSGWIVAFDGLLTLGAKIEENVSACPHTHHLMAALGKCGELLSITQLTEATLVIKSDRFKANVKCIPYDDMPISIPDDRLGDIPAELKDALTSVAFLCHEGALKAAYSGAWLHNNSVVATDGFSLVEFWHGLNFPFQAIIPRQTLTVLAKIDKKFSGIGFSNSSITFYFEDESFLKTQLILEPVPGYAHIFKEHEDDPSYISPPPELFEGLAAVEPFCNQKVVLFVGNKIKTSFEQDTGADYEMSRAICPKDCGFNVEWLQELKKFAEKINITPTKLFAFKGSYRAALMGVKLHSEIATKQTENIDEDDIPF